jgi:hypothetical protein
VNTDSPVPSNIFGDMTGIDPIFLYNAPFSITRIAHFALDPEDPYPAKLIAGGLPLPTRHQIASIKSINIV